MTAKNAYSTMETGLTAQAVVIAPLNQVGKFQILLNTTNTLLTYQHNSYQHLKSVG